MTHAVLASDSRRGGSDATYAKLRFDRQIVAIAKVHRVATIYSDDREPGAFAKTHGFEVVTLVDLPAPDDTVQGRLGLEEP